MGALPPMPADNDFGAIPVREVAFGELMQQFREAEERVIRKKTKAEERAGSRRRGAGEDRNAPTLRQDQLVALEEMQRLVREMGKKATELEERAEAAEALVNKTEERLATEVTARRDAEQARAQAVGQVEELELLRLQFQSEREEWRQKEADLTDQASQGHNMLMDREAREQAAIDALAEQTLSQTEMAKEEEQEERERT